MSKVRLKYYGIATGRHEGPQFQVIDKVYRPWYDIVDLTGGIEGSEIKHSGHTTLRSLKAQLKKDLISLGVKFGTEVRQKRANKEAIAKALAEAEVQHQQNYAKIDEQLKKENDNA